MTRRRQFVLPLALAAAIAGLLGAGDSQAASFPAVSGTFTMTGEPGHALGRGKKYSFPARAIEFEATETTAVGVEEVTISTREGGFWNVRLSSPQGTRLEVGEYVDTRGLYDEDSAFIAVHDSMHACGLGTGRFTVHDVEYGPPPGYVRSLHVTFEHHCDGAAPVLRGEIDIVAAPAPPPLKVDVTFDSRRTSVHPDGKTMALHGTIRCSHAAQASVSAAVREVKAGGTGTGMGSVTGCSPSPKTWFIPVTAQGGITFSDEELRVSISGTAPDQWYSAYEGSVVWARDTISAEAVLPSSNGQSVTSTVSMWHLILGLSIVAAAGWSLLVARWVRGRRREAG